MKNLLVLIFLIILGSGQSEQTEKIYSLDIQEYEFLIDGFDWDPEPYKFSSTVIDSVIPSRGNQYAAWDFSYIGDIEMMHKIWDSQARPRPGLTEVEQDSFALFERKNATDYILEQAKNHQVVIINEGHHMPQHRVFTTQLLDGLKKQGFKHLGLETYFGGSEADSILQHNGYPILRSGYYTKEPQFGNLIREAHQNGFQVFGYESEGHEDGKGREINQAKNIQAYMEENPGEKILIHCGFSHGYEGDISTQWEKAMAGRLKEFTGIDPLTINQVIYSERSKREFENPYYQLTDLLVPSVFVNEKGEVFGEYRHGGWFDLAVFHPRSKTYSRPSWMIYGNRKEVQVSFEDEELVCPCLVLAYKKGEQIGTAVPYDIQESNDKTAKLVLDGSDYEIIITNEKGESYKSTLTTAKGQ